VTSRSDGVCMLVLTCSTHSLHFHHAHLLPLDSARGLFTPFFYPVACGKRHIVAHEASSEGLPETWSWGHGAGDKLGHGSHSHQYQPQRISLLTGVSLKALACGDTWTAAFVNESGGGGCTQAGCWCLGGFWACGVATMLLSRGKGVRRGETDTLVAPKTRLFGVRWRMGMLGGLNTTG